MEQLFVIVQQIYELLNILNSYTQGEREELLEGYPRFLLRVKELLRILDRIVGGSTYWGWKIEWGCQPWHLMTYRQQKGLTLQAGWEHRLDFGLDLYRDTFEASLKILTPILSPRVLTPIDLDALEVKDTELDLPTDVCKLTQMGPERPVLFHELVSGSSVSSSSVGNNNETLELPVVDEGSDLDSMPELEDVPNLDLVEIPWWLIPNGVMITFREGRVIFEREQGPPWQEVLMLEEEQETTAGATGGVTLLNIPPCSMAEGPGEQNQNLFRPPMSDPEVDLERQRGARPKVTGSQTTQTKKGETKAASAEEQVLQVRGTDFYLPLGGQPRISERKSWRAPIVTEQGNPGIYVQIDEWLPLYKGNIYVVDEVTGRMYLAKGEHLMRIAETASHRPFQDHELSMSRHIPEREYFGQGGQEPPLGPGSENSKGRAG